jgi:nicotinamide phosphoribosyltransferase
MPHAGCEISNVIVGGNFVSGDSTLYAGRNAKFRTNTLSRKNLNIPGEKSMFDWLNNICWLTDSYKVSHFKQYPPGTERIYSYFESRTGSKYPEVCFFGLQYFLEAYLAGPVVTQQKIETATELFRMHFGNDVFNRSGWEYILKHHGGRLPVVIKAVPEGTIVPESNVLMTVENTDPQAYWLTNWLETLLVQVWYPATVATQSRAMKQTGDPGLIDFKLHDFGFRGVTCPEQSALGSAAHLVNFQGTDSIPGLLLARQFYQCPMAGFSIPAAEHSTITSWGEAHEVDAMRNMLTAYPTGLVACVSDSFDIFRACSEYWGGILKEQVLARDGVLVVRPDSGDPPTIVVEVLRRLGEAFGTTLNGKGYRVLHPKVRVIQGDGIDFAMLDKILRALQDAGWSADNIAFGSGGGLLQKVNRDTEKFAFKCASAVVNGETRDVFKRPVTDQGKISKAGRLKLVRNAQGQIETVREETAPTQPDLLREVFRDGAVIRRQAFDEVRQRAAC